MHVRIDSVFTLLGPQLLDILAALDEIKGRASILAAEAEQTAANSGYPNVLVPDKGMDPRPYLMFRLRSIDRLLKALTEPKVDAMQGLRNELTSVIYDLQNTEFFIRALSEAREMTPAKAEKWAAEHKDSAYREQAFMLRIVLTRNINRKFVLAHLDEMVSIAAKIRATRVSIRDLAMRSPIALQGMASKSLTRGL